MFCTKCGKELYDDDKFCAHCGAEVKEPKHARYDDVVFNPPFKIEAERRTQEILKTTEKPKAASKNSEPVSFDWNLEGFPSSQPRKTEDVDFNWDSIIEKRNTVNSIAVEKIEPELPKKPEIPAEQPAPAAETETEYEQEEPSLSIEELERELFGETGNSEKANPEEKDLEPTIIAGADIWRSKADEPAAARDERFYTYNQKFDAFQELLDKERERLQNMEESCPWEKAAMDNKCAEESLQEPERAKPLELVDVAVPAAPMTIDLSEGGATSDEENPETVKEAEHERDLSPRPEKLRYSDVFPNGLVNDDVTGPSDDSQTGKEIESKAKSLDAIYDDSDEEEESEKSHIFAKIIISILIILIVIEGGILTIRFIAPESKISLWANEVMIRAVDLLTGNGGGNGDEFAPATNDEREVYMTRLVEKASEEMKTIGEAVFSPDLKFGMLKEYSFEEIADAESFVDADWLQDEDGNPVTYGQKLIETLVKYYDSWQSANNDSSLVGINKLEIGEIRTGREGFYALCRISYAGEDGNDVVKYQTVYLRISGDAMIINEIKEDKL